MSELTIDTDEYFISAISIIYQIFTQHQELKPIPSRADISLTDEGRCTSGRRWAGLKYRSICSAYLTFAKLNSLYPVNSNETSLPQSETLYIGDSFSEI